MSRSFMLRLLVNSVLAGIACLSMATSRASALDLGLMSGDNSWQESSGWEVMQRSGATVFRGAISASQYENATQWTEIKNMFRFAAERGMVILPYLYGRPENGSSQFLSQTELEGPIGSKWDKFVTAVVQTFGYNGSFWSENPSLPYHPVGAWEIWNEPNLPENNPGGASVFPQSYGKFMKHTSEGVKSAQAAISGTQPEIVFGGLYSKVSNSEWSVGEFLAKVKELETKNGIAIGPSFNALSLHPYSFTNGMGTSKKPGVIQYVEGARSHLTERFGNKSLWITELGWNVKPWAEGDTNHLPVTVDQQAKYLTESFNWIKSVAEKLNIHLLIWYFYRDNNSCSEWKCHAGLRSGGESGEYRPAWYAYQAQTGAQEWPYRWQSNNLGGVATSDPDILTYGAGSLEVFERGSDGALWTRSFAGSGWNGWSSVASSVVGGPGSVWGGGQPTVVSRIGDATVNSWWWNGGSWSSFNLGGNNTSDADLSAWGTTRMDLFVRGSDNALWHRAWNSGTWGNWESLGGSLSSGPAAVSWGTNRIDVVALNNDSNRTLNHWWYDGTWHCCENLGGVHTSDPDIASTGSGHLNVFVRGSDNALWNLKYESGPGWVGWERVGGTLASGPGAVSWGQNERLDVVAQASDHSLTHWWWGPGGG